MTLILVLVALVLAVVSLADARLPWLAIAVICLAVAVLIGDASLTLDTD